MPRSYGLQRLLEHPERSFLDVDAGQWRDRGGRHRIAWTATCRRATALGSRESVYVGVERVATTRMDLRQAVNAR